MIAAMAIQSLEDMVQDISTLYLKIKQKTVF